MEFGAHLPLIDFDGRGCTLANLLEYTETAEALGYTFLCANDHLVFARPWLDGPTALAAVLSKSGHMRLATTVAIPVVRGPVQTAKTLAAIDILSGGRLVVGLGPGSSPRDYAAVGLPFEERWKRLDEVIRTLRTYWSREAPDFEGQFYSTRGISLEPHPEQRSGPPIWIGSWGSKAGLRRTARLGDGWLASGYNTTPELFGTGRRDLAEQLRAAGKDPASFPNGIASMWLYVTDDRSKADWMLENTLSPAIKRSPDELRDRLPIGSAEECAQKLAPYAAAGADRIFLWPIADEVEQLTLFKERVAPLIRQWS
jgi:alkanesulfonate monooxygenase SsuD/methylene tetrahydromethanopterin reductase-like flavin-dependent oxidoreductase (luciferase family)